MLPSPAATGNDFEAPEASSAWVSAPFPEPAAPLPLPEEPLSIESAKRMTEPLYIAVPRKSTW